MEKKQKQMIGKILLDIMPTLIGSVSRNFLKGGKTKLGVYLIALSSLSIKFFFDIDLELAAANPSVVPVAAKAVLGSGGVVLGVGLVHDLIKKGLGIFKDVKNIL